MNEFNQAVVKSQESILASNKVLKNTYMLLSVSFLISAAMATVAVQIGLGMGASFGALIAGILICWFVIPRYENSSGIGGIIAVFAFTGLMGLSIGPIVGMYLATAKGAMIVSTALGGTGIIFFAISGYALTTKKDFSFLGGFLFAGFIVVLLASVVSMFTNIPGLSLAISGAVIMIFSGFILYDTSRIINGGEDNYIRATVSLFISLYQIFAHLLHLLFALGGSD